jgi:hypothetical protein
MCQSTLVPAIGVQYLLKPNATLPKNDQTPAYPYKIRIAA